MIRLGDEVRDSITGYSGIAVSRTEHLTGAPRVCVQPKVMDGTKPAEDFWFDEGRLETLQENYRVGFQIPRSQKA
jgi:hypothetical protein